MHTSVRSCKEPMVPVRVRSLKKFEQQKVSTLSLKLQQPPRKQRNG